MTAGRDVAGQGGSGQGTSQHGPRNPLLSVVGGEPTLEELAALAAVVATIEASGEPVVTRGPASAWSDRSAMLRRPLSVGRDGWRFSAFPS